MTDDITIRPPSLPTGEALLRAAEMAREGALRARIVAATGLTAEQVNEIMVRVGRKRK